MQSHQKLSFSSLFLASLLTACGGGGSGGDPALEPGPGGPSIADSYQGLWIAEAYGWALDIDASNVRLLDYTSEFCVGVIDESGLATDDVEELFRLRDGRLEWYASTGTAAFGAPGVRFSAAMELPASCSGGVTPSRGDANYVRDPRQDLLLFAQLIDEYSVYPDLRQLSALSLYDELVLTLTEDSDDAELAEALFQLASPFADIHGTVETSVGLVKILNKPVFFDRLVDEWLNREGVAPPLNQDQLDAVNAYIGDQVARHRSITLSYAGDEAPISQAANDLLTWFQVDGVGYLAIDAMLGFGDVEDNGDELRALDLALDRALEDLRDVETLIVDVRRNGGGKDFLALAVASRFAANETLAYAKQARLASTRTERIDVFLEPRGAVQYLGPVVLLTSSDTASAAEVFTLAMRQLPGVTLLGESTQGGLSDQLSKRLLNGWSASVGNEYYLSVDGEEFEGSGIPVDIEVPQFTLESRDAGVDSAIEKVIDLLNP